MHSHRSQPSSLPHNRYHPSSVVAAIHLCHPSSSPLLNRRPPSPSPPLQHPSAIFAIPLHPLFSAVDHRLPLLLNHSRSHTLLDRFSTRAQPPSSSVAPSPPVAGRCLLLFPCHCCLPHLPHVSHCHLCCQPSLMSSSLPLPQPSSDCHCPLPSYSASRSLHNPFCLADPTCLQIQRYCCCSLQCCPTNSAQPPLPSLLSHLPPSLLPCFQLRLLAATAFLLNRSLTCHVIASLSPTAALTAANHLCPPLADTDNLVAVKSYYIYGICL
ncbi:hypothetical protein B296_00033389 [Ensete ventricosum]|uniref:Uncharacterized protein n=1 Tax=Ensete ventricosum TaxID=4639 RepID=A0A426WZG7_ENSVE|nr:hypothetical protein B296_00033389 [Ensete ventricosum]